MLRQHIGLDPQGRAERIRLLVLSVIAVAVLIGGLVESPAQAQRLRYGRDVPLTLVPGAGLGEWRIGMKRIVQPQLLRTVYYAPNNNQVGCVSFVPRLSAVYVDYYKGIRLAWVGRRGLSYLNGIATSRPGDRSIEGFVIGKAGFQAVKQRYRNGRRDAGKGWGADRLGSFAWIVEITTGEESGDLLTFWFSKSGRLVALETGGSGC